MVEMKDFNFIKFLGTAGARFVMIEQLRASGGIWVNCKGTNILIDPGPGSIVRCNASRPKLDPLKLEGIILTHRHLDHCGDINVMIEAMTEGGFKKKGIVFCPQDAVGKDSVILDYLKGFPEKLQIIKPGHTYKVKDFEFKVSPRHSHPVETYGLKFKIANSSIGLLTDTAFSNNILDFYKKTDILIICVVFFKPRPEILHLNLNDAGAIIKKLKPKKTILTHFGMTMLKAKPHLQAEILSQRLNRQIISAYDGMKIEFYFFRFFLT